jgi:hypothetical protein
MNQIEQNIHLTTIVSEALAGRPRLLFKAIRRRSIEGSPTVEGVGASWNDALAALEQKLILEYQNGQRSR